jgi:RHS repeat-associated protein
VPWRLASITDTRNRTTTFTYNGDDLLTKITDPAGREYRYGYDASFDLTTYTDPAGKITRFAYNGTWLSRITDPRGNYTDIAYDANQRVTSIKRVTNTSNGTGPTTTYQYDPGPTLCPDTTWAGCTVSTDPNGNRTSYYFDEYRRVRKTVDALGNPQSATYTADDNIENYTSASGGITKNQYSNEGNNNLERSEIPTGAFSTWKYESTEFKYWATKATDAQGNATSYEYQAGSGNLAAVQNALASQNRATFTYNANGTIASATDFKGNVTSYTYDTLGKLTLVDNPAPLGDTSYTYDAVGRVATTTDGKGQTTTYAYDALDRVTSITYHDGSQITSIYDGNGNLTSTTDNTGTTTYEYDKRNLLTKETLPGPKTNEYTYDLGGNMLTDKDAGGIVNYAYNAVNLLTTLTEPGGAQTTFVYDIDHMRTETRYPNGVTQYMRYDAANRLTEIEGNKVAGGVVLTKYTYCYRLPLNAGCTGTNDTGLRQRVIDKDGNATTYTYDVLNRLIRAEERSSAGALLNSYEYAYDGNSNRTSQVVNGTTTPYTHNAADQLTVGSGVTYSYDANGNETGNSAGRSFSFNSKDQTVSATPAGGSAIAMSYMGSGQARRVSAGSTTFQNNALGLGRETVGGNSTTYVRDDRGLLTAQRTASGSLYFLFDGIGSVAAVTDATGTVAAAYKYEPFGKIVTATGSITNPWRFLGGLGVYWDAQTGLYKMGARYYDPSLGRFTQVDPVADGSLNAYDYAGQNPINAFDPDGRQITYCNWTGIISAFNGRVHGGIGVTCSPPATVIFTRICLNRFEAHTGRYSSQKCENLPLEWSGSVQVSRDCVPGKYRIRFQVLVSTGRTTRIFNRRFPFRGGKRIRCA